MANPFDYINTLSKKTGVTPHDDINEFNNVYVQFLAARHFSYFIDTVLHANEINTRGRPEHGITSTQHFGFLNNSIQKANRFAKWEKPYKVDTIEVIKSVYGYSTKLAEEVADLFSEEDIKNLEKRLDKGG